MRSASAVLPRSHLLGIDRRGFRESEDRLQADLIPPNPARGSPDAEEAWAQKHAAALLSENNPDLAVRDEARVRGARELLGDDSMEEVFVTVPGGTVVLCHHDLFHRASRSEQGARWRPMLKVAAARMSEPASTLELPPPVPQISDGQLRREQLRLGTTAANYCVHAAVNDHLAGVRSVDTAHLHLSMLKKLQTAEEAAASVAELTQLTIDHHAEMGRLNAAYTLGFTR